MASKTLSKIIPNAGFLYLFPYHKVLTRNLVSKQSGAFLPQPKQVSLGLIRVVITVIPGLLIGASISKTIANFLEENDLFVPSDDDDDDD